MEHLAQVHHHETVGLVVGGLDCPSGDPRELGWQQAGRAAGLEDGPIEFRVDLAVISFDGTKESEFCWPPLTVVAQPIQQMARTAVQLVLDEQRPEGYTAFTGELVVRRACGCSPGQPAGH